MFPLIARSTDEPLPVVAGTIVVKDVGVGMGVGVGVDADEALKAKRLPE
jgi:hypothetical protein